MKIVHVITRLIIGGAQENTVLTCEGLHARGHDVRLMTGPTTGPEGSLVGRARSGGYAYEEVPSLVRAVRPMSDWRAVRAMTRRFRELRPDVVHTHSSKAGILGRLAAARAGVPCIVHTIHGMSFNRTQGALSQRVYAAAERHCARKCHAIVSVADAMTRQALAAGVGRAEQFHTVRSGMETGAFDNAAVDAAAVRRELGFSPGDVVVGTVARLFVNKGYEQLLEVMSRVVGRESPCPDEPGASGSLPHCSQSSGTRAGGTQTTDAGHCSQSSGTRSSGTRRIRFLWVGDGADRGRYEEELRRRGLAGRTVLTGLLPPSEMPRVLAAMDILAHTSQWEGLPRAVVQALLMERPAVSFAIDGSPEVVIPGETGELAGLGDVDAFAGAVLRLAGDAELRRAYGRRGRERCLAEFDHRLMVERLEQVYATVLSRRTPG